MAMIPMPRAPNWSPSLIPAHAHGTAGTSGGHSHSIMGSIGAHSHTTLVHGGVAPQPVPPHLKVVTTKAGRVVLVKKDRFDKATDEIRKNEGYARKTMSSDGAWMMVGDFDVILKHLGSIRPIHGGRPVFWVRQLLEIVPSPDKPRSKRGAAVLHNFFHLGLAMKITPIVGTRKLTFRSTELGLRLLQHLSGKYPSFRRFFDCYVTKKAEREIVDHTVSLMMGTSIPKYEKDFERSKEIEEKLQQAHQAHAMQQAAIQHHHQLAQLVAQQQYQGALNVWSSNQTATGTYNPIAMPMGGSVVGLHVSNQELVRQNGGVRGFIKRMIGK